MSDQFSTTDEPWSRISSFEHDSVIVSVETFTGEDHSAATTVFTSMSGSEVFHADKHCHRLHQSETFVGADGTETRGIRARTLEGVMTSWLNPIRPCDYCTQDIRTTADIVTEIDGVPEEVLKYYEPGDKRVSETWTRGDDGAWRMANRSETEVYDD